MLFHLNDVRLTTLASSKIPVWHCEVNRLHLHILLRSFSRSPWKAPKHNEPLQRVWRCRPKRFGYCGTFWGIKKVFRRSGDEALLAAITLRHGLLLSIRLHRGVCLPSPHVQGTTRNPEWRMSLSSEAKVKGLVSLCVVVSPVCCCFQTTIKNSCAIICVFVCMLLTEIHILPASWRRFRRVLTTSQGCLRFKTWF